MSGKKPSSKDSIILVKWQVICQPTQKMQNEEQKIDKHGGYPHPTTWLVWSKITAKKSPSSRFQKGSNALLTHNLTRKGQHLSELILLKMNAIAAGLSHLLLIKSIFFIKALSKMPLQLFYYQVMEIFISLSSKYRHIKYICNLHLKKKRFVSSFDIVLQCKFCHFLKQIFTLTNKQTNIHTWLCKNDPEK